MKCTKCKETRDISSFYRNYKKYTICCQCDPGYNICNKCPSYKNKESDNIFCNKCYKKFMSIDVKKCIRCSKEHNKCNFFRDNKTHDVCDYCIPGYFIKNI